MSVGAHWYSVTYGNGKFVAVADSSDVAAYSIDGITWIHNTYKTLRKVDNTNVTEEVIQEIANVQEATTITPTTSNKVAVPSGTYASGDITVAGDSDLVAANIVEGKSIFNVTGTAEPASALADELSTQDDLIAQIATALEGKSGGKNVVSISVKTKGIGYGATIYYVNNSFELVELQATANAVQIEAVGGIVISSYEHETISGGICLGYIYLGAFIYAFHSNDGSLVLHSDDRIEEDIPS